MSPKGRAGLALKASTRPKVIAERTRKTSGREEAIGHLKDSCREILQPPTRGAWGKAVSIQRRQKGKFLEEQREWSNWINFGSRGEVGSGPHPYRMETEVSSLVPEETITRQKQPMPELAFKLWGNLVCPPTPLTHPELEAELWVPKSEWGWSEDPDT